MVPRNINITPLHKLFSLCTGVFLFYYVIIMDIEHTSDLIGQRTQRIEKIKILREKGIDPFPSSSSRTHTTADIIKKYDELENKKVTVVGRIMSWRKHGDIQFIDLQDDFGRIQVYIRLDALPADNTGSILGKKDMSLIDIGDHVEVTGIVTKTKTGQISVQPEAGMKILSKSIRPLPAKWGGISDTELRFRRRYLDMTLDLAIRDRFKRRSIFWKATRDLLDSEGFIEVNTPVLEHTTGGADAKPFVTHYDVLDEDYYLRISQELPLKRLLGGGFEKVYDIGPRFRNEGFSDEHLPEHIALEWYWAYANYKDGMGLTEKLFKYVLKETFGTLKFNVRGFDIDIDTKWEVADFTEILNREYDIDIFTEKIDVIKQILHERGAYLPDGSDSRTRMIDALWKLIRKDLAGPLFVTGVPKFMSPLSKSDPSDDSKTERFFPIIAGTEMANVFSELNDPLDQLDRFEQQQKLRDSGDDEAHMLDIDFVEMLEYGMPPAVGYGSTERVFWVFEGVSAREGVPFPLMKRATDEISKKLYDIKFG